MEHEEEVETVEEHVEELPAEAVEGLDEQPEADLEPTALADLLFGDTPKSIKALDAALQAEGRKSFSVKPEEIDALPHAAKRVLHNYDRAFKAKTRELSEARKGLFAQQNEVKQQRLMLEQERAKLYGGLLPLAEMFKAPDGEVPEDRFSEEGFDYYARKHVASMMSPFFEKLQAVADQGNEEVQAAVEEARVSREKEELREFIATDEAWWEGNKRLVRALVKGEGLHWREAVAEAKRLSAPAASDPDEERKAVRESAARLGNRGGIVKQPGTELRSLSYKQRRRG